MYIFISLNGSFVLAFFDSSVCPSVTVKGASNLTGLGICSHSNMSKSANTRDGLLEN